MTPLHVAQAGRWADWHGLDEPGLVVLDDPPTGDGLDAPAAPELVQPARHEIFGFETTEHVWPRRGLVLVVAAPYDHTPAHDRAPRIVRAELFAPCSLDEWRATIAPRSAPRGRTRSVAGRSRATSRPARRRGSASTVRDQGAGDPASTPATTCASRSASSSGIES